MGDEDSDAPVRVSPSLLGEFVATGQCRRFLALRSRYAAAAAAAARWCGADGTPLPCTERLLLECGVPCVAGARRMPPSSSTSAPTDTDKGAWDAVRAAHVRCGVAWEAALLARLAADRACRVVAAPDGARLSAADTLAALRDDAWCASHATLVLYQATLAPPAGFGAALGTGAALAVPPCYPDFVLVHAPAPGASRDARRCALVVDAKGSARVHAAHMVQVALYARVLRAVLAAARLDAAVRVADEGGVWLRDAPACTRFALAPAEDLAVRALQLAARDAAPGTATGTALAAVPWACGAHCARCPYRAFCERHAAACTAARTDTGVAAAVRMQTRLTPDDAALVGALLARASASDGSGRTRLADCAETAAFVEHLCAAPRGAAPAAALPRLEALLPALHAALAQRPCATRAAALALPVRGEDVAVLCTLAFDAPTRRLAGFHVAVRGTRGGSLSTEALRDELGAPLVCVRRPRTDADSRAVGAGLVAALHRVLDAAHRHNAAVPAAQWQRRLSLTVHTFAARDTRLLLSVLAGAACDEGEDGDEGGESETARQAQQLLGTLFPTCGGVVHARTLPDVARLARPPLCTLEPELARLFALPLRWWEGGLEACARAFGVRSAAAGTGTGTGTGTDATPTLNHVLCAAAARADAPGAPPTLFGDTLAAALAARSALHADLLRAVRAALRTSARAARGVQHAPAFAWLPRVAADGPRLSRVRAQCAFAAAHELALAAQTLAAQHAALDFASHVRHGDYLRCTVRPRPDDADDDALADAMAQLSLDGKAKTKTTRKQHTMTLAVAGMPVQPSAEFESTRYWWLIPDAPEGSDRARYYAELDARLVAEAEPRRLFSRRAFVVPPRWARVTVEQRPGPGGKGEGGDGVLTVSSYTRLPADGNEGVATYFLVPACFDANTPLLLRHLTAEPAEAEAAAAHGEARVTLEELVAAPGVWAREPFGGAAARVTAEAQALADGADGADGVCAALTASQRAAVQAILAAHAHLLWGPPGTGKTSTLTALVLVLAAATRRCRPAAPPLRVLMTALSNANIDHFLAALRRRRAAAGLAARDIALGRLDPRTHRVTDLDHGGDGQHPQQERLEQFIAGHTEAVVVAGTVWQMRAAGAGRVAFDLVVWDDASQCRPAELAIPAACLARARSRLVVAGDPHQLPPVRRGAAAFAPDELAPVAGWLAPAAAARLAAPPALAGSLFDALRAAGAPVSVLCESWRGNAALCAVLRASVYSRAQCPAMAAAYAPACPRVADARLAVHAPPAAPRVVHFALAPVRSLVVVLYRWDGAATQTDACPEAAVAAQLCRALRTSAELRAVPAREFWARRLMLVCPHHFQRAAIRAALAACATDEDEEEVEEEEGAAVCVETVERAQGQERDVGIVDYALFSTQRVRAETEFLYDAHRLNVAVSRCRTKCIVLLSEHVLAAWAPDALLRSPAAARGLAFLHALTAFARAHDSLYTIDPPPPAAAHAAV